MERPQRIELDPEPAVPAAETSRYSSVLWNRKSGRLAVVRATLGRSRFVLSVTSIDYGVGVIHPVADRSKPLLEGRPG